MPVDPQTLYQTPNALAGYYTRFRVSERILLTGHSHQAWPDRGFAGQQQAWLDAAELADEKWERAFAKADRVRFGYAQLLDDRHGQIALGTNTHELVMRFLSGLPLRERPRLVTTDGEFHSIRRQLDRLAEEGLEIVKVPAGPARTVDERLANQVNGRTAAVLVSKVFFQNAAITPPLGELMGVCRDQGTELLVDVYHALNVVPFSIVGEGLEDAYLTGGGYKYCQLGEGNCFLRFPAESQMRPLITGWFSEYEALETGSERVIYGRGPARFAGATYDPTSHYRAAAVFDFFDAMDLSPKFLREISQHQVGLLWEGFNNLRADPAIIRLPDGYELPEIGGFLALDTPYAAQIQTRLLAYGIHTDYRKDTLRLGPAPYLSDDQLMEAVERLGKVIAQLPAPMPDD